MADVCAQEGIISPAIWPSNLYFYQNATYNSLKVAKTGCRKHEFVNFGLRKIIEASGFNIIFPGQPKTFQAAGNPTYSYETFLVPRLSRKDELNRQRTWWISLQVRVPHKHVSPKSCLHVCCAELKITLVLFIWTYQYKTQHVFINTQKMNLQNNRRVSWSLGVFQQMKGETAKLSEYSRWS